MKNIGIIGCGNMGETILKGIISSRAASPKHIHVFDVDSTKLNRIKSHYNVDAAFSNSLVASSSDIIIIAVKPQDIRSVLNSISEYLGKDKLIISVAAGITIKKIGHLAGKDTPVVRAMPNMPAMVGKGFTAVSFSKGVTKDMANRAAGIFASVGDVVRIEEPQMDAVTAIAGSGPAYFFYLVELLIKSGVSLGLSPKVAREAVLKTALGSIELLLRHREDPSALRKKVASKGGTTEAAFRVFEKRGLDRIIRDAVQAARDRSRELAGR